MSEPSDFSRLLGRASRYVSLPALATVVGLAGNPTQDEAPPPPLDEPSPTTLTVPSRPAGIHLETVYAYENPEWIASRHADAATAISQRAATQMASGVEVRERAGDPFDTATMGRALHDARVVSVSMISNRPVDMDAACKRFEALPGIVVQSAGNGGLASPGPLQPQQSSALQCADLILRVGAAHDGALESYSDRSTPDLIGENPFRQGFGFPVSLAGDDLRASIANRLPQMQAEFVRGKAAAEIARLGKATDADARERVRQLTLEKGALWNGFRAEQEKTFAAAAQPFFAKMQARADMQRTDQWLNGLPGMRQLLTALNSTAPTYRTMDGTVHNSDGTSWSGPAVGGTVAAALQRLPRLSDEDAVVAALVSARKTAASHAAGVAVDYRHNARGLSFDNNGAGFGIFDPDGFAATMKRMEALRQDDPAAATRRVAIAPTERSGRLERGMALSVRQQGVALRAMAVVIVPEGALKDVPLTLTAPDGTQVKALPARSRTPDGRDMLSFASSAMLGSQTAGTWHLQAPEGAPAHVQLRLVAVPRGSVADRAIDLAVKDGPQPVRETVAVEKLVLHAQQRWGAAAPAAPAAGAPQGSRR